MPTVFIAGSIKIKNLHPLFVDRIANIVGKDMDIVVGDANGADTSIQCELSRQNAENVTVYCSGDKPRNNVGQWSISKTHTTAKPGSRAFFSEKDIKMANAADFGLMLWDASSTGTLSNVIELLKGGKKCVVFANKLQEFIIVKEPNDILNLIDVMSDGAKAIADRKIGLKSKVYQITNEQFGMAF